MENVQQRCKRLIAPATRTGALAATMATPSKNVDASPWPSPPTGNASAVHYSTASTSTSKSFRIDYEKLTGKRQVETSETIRKCAQTTHERQVDRFKGIRITCNAETGPNEVRDFCIADAVGEKFLKLPCNGYVFQLNSGSALLPG